MKLPGEKKFSHTGRSLQPPFLSAVFHGPTATIEVVRGKTSIAAPAC
jgi:hypothetical protein